MPPWMGTAAPRFREKENIRLSKDGLEFIVRIVGIDRVTDMDEVGAEDLSKGVDILMRRLVVVHKDASLSNESMIRISSGRIA